MSPVDLADQQEQLQNEANDVLKELKLLEELKKYGRIHTVGSLSSGLMTWRDIDIVVIVPKLDRTPIHMLCTHFIDLDLARIDLSVIDFRNDKRSYLPRTLFLCAKYMHSGAIWRIEIHFATEEEAPPSIEDVAKLKSQLTPQTRHTILALKHELATHHQYRKQIFSIDIYRAVLEHKVRDMLHFKEYLRQTGRELE